MLGLAIGEIDNRFGYVYDASTAVADFVLGGAESKNPYPYSGKRYEWSWNNPQVEVEFHIVAEAELTEGEPGSFIVSNCYYHNEKGWFDNSWEVYYDENVDQQLHNNDTTGSSFGTSIFNSKDPIAESPNPPENPEEWTYYPVPANFQTKKYQLNSFQKMRTCVRTRTNTLFVPLHHFGLESAPFPPK